LGHLVSLHAWGARARRGLLHQVVILACRKAAAQPAGQAPAVSESAEVRRLKAELKRVTEERDILKKAAAYFARG